MGAGLEMGMAVFRQSLRRLGIHGNRWCGPNDLQTLCFLSPGQHMVADAQGKGAEAVALLQIPPSAEPGFPQIFYGSRPIGRGS